jgi:general secretion pathway protein H
MKGFTLIELLVVMAILGLVLVAAVPLLPTSLSGVELRSAARQVASGMRTARARAIAQNREAVFSVDVENRLYGVAGQPGLGRLPAGFEVRLITADTELTGPTSGGIRFFPDGSSTGGQVLLSGRGQRSTLAVDWLTGQVSLRD